MKMDETHHRALWIMLVSATLTFVVTYSLSFTGRICFGIIFMLVVLFCPRLLQRTRTTRTNGTLTTNKQTTHREDAELVSINEITNDPVDK